MKARLRDHSEPYEPSLTTWRRALLAGVLSPYTDTPVVRRCTDTAMEKGRWLIMASVAEVRRRLADEGGDPPARVVRRTEIFEEGCPLLVQGSLQRNVQARLRRAL